MVKSQKILKEEKVSKKKIQNPLQQQEVTTNTTEETTQLINRWSQEIESIKSMKFTSIEEAVKTIAHNVIEKLQVTGPKADQTKLFVEEILLTDPTITDQLKATLNIK